MLVTQELDVSNLKDHMQSQPVASLFEYFSGFNLCTLRCQYKIVEKLGYAKYAERFRREGNGNLQGFGRYAGVKRLLMLGKES